MNFFTHNIIKKGILGILVLFVLLVPVSISVTTSDVVDGVIVIPQFAIETNTAAAITLFDIGKNSVDLVFNTLGGILLNLASIITYMGGKLLDISIEKFVLGMGDQINGQSLGTAIDETWRLIRDISNLAFIFGFIYTGIRTILDPNDSGYKRFLSKIIIGALLINFSLFFVKVIIDVANFTSIQIYNAMIQGPGKSIATVVVDQLGIITLYSSKSVDSSVWGGGSPSFWFFIMASIFLVVTGFVFAASAIMIIIRFVTLVFIMIFSPILFAATVFPQTEKYASELWSKLMSSAFYVPVYLLLTFISISLVGKMNVGGNKDWIGALANQPDAYGVILQFVVIIFFMMQSLLIANKFSIAGSSMITTKTKELIGASTAGLAARAGRGYLGRKAADWSEDEALKDKASQKGIGGWAARQRLKSYRGIGDASFDARNTGAGKALKIGSGRKGGFISVKKEVTEAEEKFAKSLGEVGDDDVRVAGRKKEMEGEKNHVRHLQEELKGTTNQAKRIELSDLIEVAKHHEHEKKVKYETEKQRRILGSTYEETNNEELDTLKFQTEIMKENVKKLWDGNKDEKDPTKNVVAYLKLSDKDQEARRVAIEKLNKEISDAEKEHRALFNKVAKDIGYAGVRESSVWYKAWPTGRMVTHEQSAGKAMRKARKDGLPKEKGGHGGHDDHDKGDHDDEHVAHAPAPAAAPHAPSPAAHAPAGGGHGGGAHH